jgi:alpha-D-ribose 1-methylphosphonate 5-phosphate C-P lyase
MVGGRTDIATVPRLNKEHESYKKAEAKILGKETVLDHEITERTVRSKMI